MARWRWLLSAALAASATSNVATVQAEEGSETARAVSIDEIPAPARDAILGHVGTGVLMEVQEETGQGGEHVYEASIKRQGRREHTILVDESGNILGGG
jgi:hypothetical protein